MNNDCGFTKMHAKTDNMDCVGSGEVTFILFALSTLCDLTD